MDNKNIILIVIAILVVILLAVGIYSLSNGNVQKVADTSNLTNKTTSFIDIGTINADDINETNKTVGDNSTFNKTENYTNNNTPYKVYNPQSDSYVPVIGEKFDDEVNRWYTYDEDGVRYYNTRINQG